MKVLILGSTGMVGSEVLERCIQNPKIKKITVVNRDQGIENKKVTAIVHSNFLDFSEIKKDIMDHDICFYCIGVYQGDVPEQKFIEITHDYLVALAKTIESKKTIFCLFSAQGADPKSSILFAKWKGKAEESLQKLQFRDVYIVRPGYIHPENKQKSRKKLFYRVVGLFYPILNKIAPQYCTNSGQLAKAMVRVAIEGSEKKVLENMDIRAMGSF